MDSARSSALVVEITTLIALYDWGMTPDTHLRCILVEHIKLRIEVVAKLNNVNTLLCDQGESQSLSLAALAALGVHSLSTAAN